ncbi:MAG TPA: helix-turn-helix domain-containing protein [Baekduia sp.]|nr:helix-turn-helix domain-containing protein [Baekduia sp.]
MDFPAIADANDVLAQPTRARLFALLEDARRPVGTQELADQLGLHPNGVRLHLERLERAGLVERARAKQARGRPRDAWAIAADAQPGGRRPSAYGDLGRWLARAIPVRPGRLREVEAAGREVGRELAPADAGATQTLRTTLATLGFQPTVESDADADVTTFCLRNCPYRDAVLANRDVVCTLHRGMTRGLLDVLRPEAKLEAFVPKDPEEAGCLITVAGLGEQEEA